MDPLAFIEAREGVFLTHEVKALGMDGYAIARAVRGGLWHRVRRGAFVAGATWSAADALERHRILAAAIHRSYGDRVAFSHVTAAVLHGIAVWGVDLSRVHVTRLDGGAGRTEPDVVHHEAWCLEAHDVVRLDGGLVTAPARSALECGVLSTSEQALVSLDSALATGTATRLDLENVYDVMQHWPRTQHLQIALRMADPGAQSPGESRARWMFYAAGLPAPILQYAVRDETGQVIGWSDFAWPRRRMLGEFDGRVKYGRLLKPGQEPGDVVFAEKVREDQMRRATGFGMLRLVWVDLDRPAITVPRLRTALDDAA